MRSCLSTIVSTSFPDTPSKLYIRNAIRPLSLLQIRIRQGDRRPSASPEDATRELRLLGNLPPEEGEWPRYFIGTPSRVREQLEAMAEALGISELIVNTILWNQTARLRSYELLAKAFQL